MPVCKKTSSRIHVVFLNSWAYVEWTAARLCDFSWFVIFKLLCSISKPFCPDFPMVLPRFFYFLLRWHLWTWTINAISSPCQMICFWRTRRSIINIFISKSKQAFKKANERKYLIDMGDTVQQSSAECQCPRACMDSASSQKNFWQLIFGFVGHMLNDNSKMLFFFFKCWNWTPPPSSVHWKTCSQCWKIGPQLTNVIIFSALSNVNGNRVWSLLRDML